MVSHFQRAASRTSFSKGTSANPEFPDVWDAIDERRCIPRRTKWNTTFDIRARRPQDPTLYDRALLEFELEQAQDAIVFSCDGARGHRATSSNSRPHSAPAIRRRVSLREACAPDAVALLPKRSRRPHTAPQLRFNDARARPAPCRVEEASQGNEQADKRTRSRGHVGTPASFHQGSPLSERSKQPFADGADVDSPQKTASSSRRVHEDQVRFHIGKLKTESRMGLDALRKIDVWNDQSLFDLKVLHNRAARNKTEKEKKQRESEAQLQQTPSRGRTFGHRIGPNHPKWKELAAVDKMKNLCNVLDMELRLHKEKPDDKLKTSEAELDRDLEVTMMPDPPIIEELQPQIRRSNASLHNLFASERTAATLARGIEALSQAFLTRKRRGQLTQVNPEIKSVALNLLEVLLERCSNIAEFLHLLDMSNTGRISRRDWETAMMAMGCVSDEPSRFFKAMDSEGSGELMVEDILEVLKDQMPALASRQDQASPFESSRSYQRRQSVEHLSEETSAE